MHSVLCAALWPWGLLRAGPAAHGNARVKPEHTVHFPHRSRSEPRDGSAGAGSARDPRFLPALSAPPPQQMGGGLFRRWLAAEATRPTVMGGGA